MVSGAFSFVWKKDGATLSPSARISIVNTATNSHLTISGLVGSDNGNYCVDVTGLCIYFGIALLVLRGTLL